MDSQKIIILDIRVPSLPAAVLDGHSQCVNALAWAPHSSCHICTAGDDNQALIWDLSTLGQKQISDPILAYYADSEVNQLQWYATRYSFASPLAIPRFLSLTHLIDDGFFLCARPWMSVQVQDATRLGGHLLRQKASDPPSLSERVPCEAAVLRWQRGMAVADGGAALRGWKIAGAQPQRAHHVVGTACRAARTRLRNSWEERFPDPAERLVAVARFEATERRASTTSSAMGTGGCACRLQAGPGELRCPLYSRLGVERVSTRAEQRRACLAGHALIR